MPGCPAVWDCRYCQQCEDHCQCEDDGAGVSRHRVEQRTSELGQSAVQVSVSATGAGPEIGGTSAGGGHDCGALECDGTGWGCLDAAPERDCVISRSSMDRENEMFDLVVETRPWSLEYRRVVRVYDCSRAEAVLRQNGCKDGGGTFVPISACDLSMTKLPFMTPCLNHLGLSIEHGRLWVSSGGVARAVNRVSDLYITPWSSSVRWEWSVRAQGANDVISGFCILLRSGTLQLTSERGADCGHKVAVEFDSPFPAIDGFSVTGMSAVKLAEPPRWRSECLSLPGDPGPVWLNQDYYVPWWWPENAIFDTSKTVWAFVDGTRRSNITVDGRVQDSVVRLLYTEGGTEVCAYMSDIYGSGQSAVWIDVETVDRQRANGTVNVYVVGTDGLSCMVSGAGQSQLECAVEPFEVEIGNRAVYYPNHAMCERVGTRLSLKKVRGYSSMARVCRRTVPEVIAAMALSPYHLDLSTTGNCVLGVFRTLGGGISKCLGPITVEDARSSGLFTGSRRMVSEFGRRCFDLEEGHVMLSRKIGEAEMWPEDGELGGEDVEAALMRDFGGISVPEPASYDTSLKFGHVLR